MAMQFDDDDDSFAGLRDDEKGPTDFPWDSDIPE
jgi:hypothetical protein